MSTDTHRAKFFRQSGWMFFATLAGGVCMFAVHIIFPKLGDKEYGLFGTLLSMLNVLTIPALGLQTTFAQQAAAAITPEDRARLSGTVRTVLYWAFVLWGLMAILAAAFMPNIMARLSIPDPVAFCLVALFAFCLLWQPIFFGTLQGCQNFLWLGWSLMTNGFGRLVAVIIIVFYLGGLATGAMAGALFGVVLSVLLAGIQTRATWLAPQRLPIEWRAWLVRIVPLTLGLGAFQYIFSVDMLVVRDLFGEQCTGYYSAAGMIARGLVMFTAPIAVVMFPKLVHSAKLGQKTNVLAYTLISVAVLGTVGAIGCTWGAQVMHRCVTISGYSAFYLPAFIVAKLQSKPEAVQVISQLIPWFVWCMLPLTLANVLLNNLLAHKAYRVIPWLILVVAAYTALAYLLANPVPDLKTFAHFKRIIQIVGISNLVFLGVCAFFTARLPAGNQAEPAAP